MLRKDRRPKFCRPKFKSLKRCQRLLPPTLLRVGTSQAHPSHEINVRHATLSLRLFQSASVSDHIGISFFAGKPKLVRILLQKSVFRTLHERAYSPLDRSGWLAMAFIAYFGNLLGRLVYFEEKDGDGGYCMALGILSSHDVG